MYVIIIYPLRCPSLSRLIRLRIGGEYILVLSTLGGTMARCKISIYQLACASFLMGALAVVGWACLGVVPNWDVIPA